MASGFLSITYYHHYFGFLDRLRSHGEAVPHRTNRTHCDRIRPVTTNETVSQVLVQPAAVARALRHPIRRAALATVLDRGGRIPVAALAAAVIDRRETFGIEEATDERSIRVSLHHRHLPVLVSADLLSLDGDAVAAGAHRLLSHPGVDAAALEHCRADWDALGAVFGQERRYLAVSVLADASLPVGLASLSRLVAAERVGDIGPDAPVFQDFESRLHHVDLPILDDAGVVDYDVEAQQVTAVSKPDLPIPICAL